MLHRITVMPGQLNIEAPAGGNLLAVLRDAGLAPDAPCGGTGRCGKCTVTIDGSQVLACRRVIDRDMTVVLPSMGAERILTAGISVQGSPRSGTEGYLLAFDIGTTTVAGYLLDGRTGRVLASESLRNPQAPFGADVVSRIRHALNGQMEPLTACIRQTLEQMTLALCAQAEAAPAQIRTVGVVGNPAMQQLFLGISPENLVRIPFAPVLTQAKTVPAKEYLPSCENAELLIVPDISGYVGADTVGCILSTGLDQQEDLTLLVDIGTNGEMVLGNQHRMVACATAAGPALEGASISCGMRAQTGAIDRVRLVDGNFQCSVIGGGEAAGVCGSGLIGTVAAALDAGLLNERGSILTPDRVIRLAERVVLTQEDIRQVQLAKGAIAAGIELMAGHLGVSLGDIQKVYLAGAFGTYLDPASACRIGLLPSVLAGRIVAVGNAAGSGAEILARDVRQLDRAQTLTKRIAYLELSSAPGFRRSFARNMRF